MDAAYTPASADEIDSKVAVEWFRLLVRLAKSTPGFSPPVAARAYGYMGVTLYEAVMPGMPGYQSLAGQLVDMPEMPQPPARRGTARVPERSEHKAPSPVPRQS